MLVELERKRETMRITFCSSGVPYAFNKADLGAVYELVSTFPSPLLPLTEAAARCAPAWHWRTRCGVYIRGKVNSFSIPLIPLWLIPAMGFQAK
jgi:hypothetical protein